MWPSRTFPRAHRLVSSRERASLATTLERFVEAASRLAATAPLRDAA